MWMVRAGRGGNRVDDFVQQGVAGFLEDKLPDVGDVKSKDELLALYAALQRRLQRDPPGGGIVIHARV